MDDIIALKQAYMTTKEVINRELLLTKIQDALIDQLIDMDVYEKIIDPKVSVKELEEYLKAQSQSAESYLEQLRQEFPSLEIEEKEEEITFIHPFVINKKCIQDYFDLTQEDVEKLYKRGGFIEIFAVLRLPKVMKEIKESLPQELLKGYHIDHSLVYYLSESHTYNIDLLITIPKNEDLTKVKSILGFFLDKYQTMF